jgi:hypothetical protein
LFGYLILITTWKGESERPDLPFLFPHSRIFRACSLTQNGKMRYGADILIIPEISAIFGYSQYLTSFQNPECFFYQD